MQSQKPSGEENPTLPREPTWSEVDEALAKANPPTTLAEVMKPQSAGSSNAGQAATAAIAAVLEAAIDRVL